MPYEWDEAKRRGNIGKHGIDFTAIRRFRWNIRIISLRKANLRETRRYDAP